MPNWCIQNAILTGPKEQLQELCDIVNSLPEREQQYRSDFGCWWLWNFYNALAGLDLCRDSGKYRGGRGTVSPEPEDSPCFTGPCSPENGTKARVEESAAGPIVRLSFTTAWEPDNLTYEVIGMRFPDIMLLAHKETDEFGNFHTMSDSCGLFDQPQFVCECEDGPIERDDEKEFVAEVADAMGLEKIPESFAELKDIFYGMNGEEANRVYSIYKWETID